jgi:hypothetical protein
LQTDTDLPKPDARDQLEIGGGSAVISLARTAAGGGRPAGGAARTQRTAQPAKKRKHSKTKPKRGKPRGKKGT